ncbi:MAG: hypothetical protein AB7O31_11140 [Burkholderiales bacterium]
MKVKRDIASIPLRSGDETWAEYRQLVTGPGSVDAVQFDAAATVMTSLITDEAFRDEPLNLSGVSHRLVVYLLHGHDALEAGANIDKLAWNPTAGDWKLFVPCPEEQFEWAKKTLAARAPRFVVLKPGEKNQEEKETEAPEAALGVNWEVLGR